MKLFRPIWMVALFSCFLLVCSCIRQPEQKRIVTVTIQPQKYFAEKIAGQVPILHLLCTRNPSAVYTVQREINTLEEPQ